MYAHMQIIYTCIIGTSCSQNIMNTILQPESPRFLLTPERKVPTPPNSTKELMVQSKSKANKRIGEAPGCGSWTFFLKPWGLAPIVPWAFSMCHGRK